MADLQELLEAIDVEWYLDREGIDYKSTHGSRGRQLNIKECPTCHGDTYKVYMNADTGLGNCFHGSCGATFNKYKFIRAHLGEPSNHDVIAHIKEVAREMGWRPKRMTVVEVEEAASAGWRLPDSFEIPIEGQNLVYLENRGVNIEIAKYFHLRYCHMGWFNYKNAEGEERGQNHSGRIIIPVYDLEGKLVTFQGRDITGTSQRKYLFPPGLPGTGRFLYNGHNAVGAKRAVMGEGAFDVIATKVALDGEVDLRDVVPIGSFGKHLSHKEEGADQLAAFMKLRERGLQEITVMWDGEPDALEAALRAAEILTGVGFKMRIALLPKDKDPNEVPPAIVCQAFWKAEPYSRALATKWRLRNPYK